MPPPAPTAARAKGPVTFLAALAALVALKSLVTRLYEPDLWWQLALARQMLSEGHVTRLETLSYTFAGAPYINFEWLSQLVFYGVWRWSGMAGLFTLKIVLGAAVAALTARALRAWGARGGLLLGLWWSVFWTLRPRLNERAEMATLIALPVFLMLARAGLVSPTRRRFACFAGAGLGVLWANAHGGWVLAPALAVALAVGAAWTPAHRRAAPFLLALAASVCAGALLNPYGPGLLLVHVIHLANLGHGSAVPAVIQEWGPTTLAAAPLFWALFAAVAGTLLTGLLRRSPAARLWAPAVVLFGVSGAAYYRNAALFVFAAGPFLAMWMSEGPKRGRRWLALLLPAAVSVTLAFPAMVRPWPRSLAQWQRLPVGACRFLTDNDIRGRMFNTLDQGGFLEWTLGPDRRIFIDGRYLFFPLVTEMTDALATAGFGPFLERHGVDHAVVNYDFFAAAGASGRTLFPPAEWALVYWDDAALVYLRRVPSFATVIAGREYRVARPDGAAAPAGDAERTTAREEMARHRREVPFSVVAGNLAAQLGAAR